MKCVDRADQCLSYYSLLRKTVKWPKKVIHFNSFRTYQKLNPTSKMSYKEFLLQVAKDWATDKFKTDTDAARPGTSTQTPRVPHENPPGSLVPLRLKWLLNSQNDTNHQLLIKSQQN
jgi:hypothetical protein